MDMLLVATSLSDELFGRINIEDFERTRTPKIRVFFIVFFAIFGFAVHFKNAFRRNGWRWIKVICEQELL